MSMKDEFLSEAKVGKNVDLIIGPKQIIGTIVLLDDSIVQIKKEDGRLSTIALDNIGCFEFLDNDKDEKIKIISTGLDKKELYENNDDRVSIISENIENELIKDDQQEINVVIEKQPKQTLTLQPISFDYNAINTRGLVFETCYWHNDIHLLSLTPTIKEKIKEIDHDGYLMAKLNTLLNKLLYCDKVNEFEPKFGRIKPITVGINELCEKYNEDFLYELLAIILIHSDSTYKEALKKICINSIIRLSDAVVCYNKKKYEEMTYYCSEFYSNVKLTEQNVDNFLFSISYLIKYGCNDVLQMKKEDVKTLSKYKQIEFTAIYNNAKYYILQETESNINSKETSSILKQLKIEELQDKVEKLVENDIFFQAYNIVENMLKQYPENEKISELLQYVIKELHVKIEKLVGNGNFSQVYNIIENICKQYSENKDISELLQYVIRKFKDKIEKFIRNNNISQAYNIVKNMCKQYPENEELSRLLQYVTIELHNKVEKLVKNNNISQAYNIVEKIFKQYPENKELSELLQYVEREKNNSSKFDNIQTGETFYAKKLIEEFPNIKKLLLNNNISHAYDIVEKMFKQNPENEKLSELLQYVGKVKINSNKFKNLPLNGTFYAKALRDWHIYENIPSAKENFLLSIKQKENRFFSAIMDYVELIMHIDGEKLAVETLMSYEDTIRGLDYDSKIKYFEKLTSLYSKGKDYDKMLQCLVSLKKLYETKFIRTSGVGKKRIQAKVAGTIFRIAQCQYMRGEFNQSIKTTREALSYGHNIYVCVNQIVSCYLSQNDYESARKVVRVYSKDYNFIELFEKIDSLEDAYNSNQSDGEVANDQVDFYELLGFDNEFINFYESSCGYEGISEERKISKDFTEDDLDKIEKEIKYASKAKPKDRADYYLTAACIEKILNDRSDEYYYFIANSMLYHGHLLLANRNFDSAKSFYLTAIGISQKCGRQNIEQVAICNYMYCLLNQPKTQIAEQMLKFESEIMILISKFSGLINKDRSILFDIVRLLNVSKELKKFFTKNADKSICKDILNETMKLVSCDKMDEQFWVNIGRKYKEAETFFNKWYSDVQLDKNFENDIECAAVNVIKSLLVTAIDIEYINSYLARYKEIREYTEYSDFDNRIRILNQGMNAMHELITIGHKNSTLFFENYLLRIINITIENLNNIVSRTSEDYKPELSIEVPITNIRSDNGYIKLSITISNADNKATARNITLIILGLDKGELCRQSTKINLKGGAEISELVRIPIGKEEAFTLTIVLNYKDDEDEDYNIEKQISISTNVEDFENIRNPYITGKPVSDDNMFFGRDVLVQRLVDAICDDRIRCVVIYGQKRTGKSSIFNHLKRKLTERFVVLNFSVGADITSEKNFYKSVQKEFVDYLEDNEFEEDIIESFDDYKILDFIDFEKFMGKINRTVRKLLNKELLLMIDEFTHIYTYIKNPNYGIGDNFMDKWKAMIEKNLFKSALIGQDFMLDFIKEYANQFQVTDPIYVSYLERKDAIDLVIKPIAIKNGGSRFLEGSEEMIVDWFNGQPYYLQTYCSKLVDYINKEQKQNYITAAVAKKVKDLMLTDVKLDFFDNLVRLDEKDMLEVLLKMAQASDIAGTKIHIDRLHLDENQKNILEQLATRGVVDYSKSEQKCCITIPFFHEWLRQSY